MAAAMLGECFRVAIGKREAQILARENHERGDLVIGLRKILPISCSAVDLVGDLTERFALVNRVMTVIVRASETGLRDGSRDRRIRRRGCGAWRCKIGSLG